MKMPNCVACIAFLLAGPAQAERPVAERVTFTTADGVEIVADYYAPPPAKRLAPVAICVHMFPAERTSWQPLAPALLRAGFAVLAYDMRGAGESVLPKDKYLRRYYSDRDPKLFAAAWQDAAAAVKWLKDRPECDAKRIVMIGASVGCSISIDYAGRDKNVRGLVCLSPGIDYMELDSRKHIGRIRDRAILLVAPEEERDGPEKLAKAAKTAELDIRPGTAQLHGTRMFAADYGEALIERIAEFATASLERPEKKEAAGESSGGKPKKQKHD